MHITTCFPVAVFTHDIESNLADRIENTINPLLKTLDNVENIYTDYYSKDKIISESLISKEDDIKTLMSLLSQYCENYVSILGIRNHKRKIQGWVQDYKEGNNHCRHNHCERIDDISGVYYISGNEKCSNIRLYNPIPFMHLHNKSVEDTQFNSQITELEIKKGRLYMFPSWLDHDVIQSKENGDIGRSVFAFNFIKDNEV